MNICRLCDELIQSDELSVELNDHNSSEWTYKDLIEYHTRVFIKPSKLLPQSICQDCKEEIDRFSEFSVKVQNVQDKLEEKEFEDSTTEIKECSVQIEPIDEDLLPKRSRKKRKRTTDQRGHEDSLISSNSSSKRSRFESIIIKVEPNDDMTDGTNEFGDMVSSDEKEELVKDDSSKNLRRRKVSTNTSAKRLKIKNQGYDELEQLFSEAVKNSSGNIHLHLNIPESFKLQDGKIAEQIDENVNSLRWKDLFKCLICGDVKFDNIIDMKKHQKEKHKTSGKVFGCHICENGMILPNYKVGAKSENTLQNHLADVHFMEHLKFCCMVCSKMFYDFRSLLNHYKSHDGYTKFDCLICGHAAKNFENLKTHKEITHAPKEKTKNHLLCEKIQDKFDQGVVANPINILVEDHEQNEDGTVSDECQRRLAVDWSFGSYNCSVCSINYKTPFDLYAHTLVNHPIPRKYRNLGKNLNKKIYSCNVCESKKDIRTRQKFDHFYSFINHAISEAHDANIQFTCLCCLKHFWNLRALVLHYKEVHPSFRFIICNHCGKVYSDIQTAAIHYNNEVAEGDEKIVKQVQNKEYSCEMCGYLTNLKKSMEEHMLYVHKFVKPEDMVTCEICGLRLLSKIKLNVHMKTHSDVKCVSCEFCGKSYKYKSSLVVHIRKEHDKIREMKCSYCDRTYYDGYSLKVHERRHRGEKPFGCDQDGCAATFVDRGKLNLHLKVRHGIDGRSEPAKRRAMLNQTILSEK